MYSICLSSLPVFLQMDVIEILAISIGGDVAVMLILMQMVCGQ